MSSGVVPPLQLGGDQQDAGAKPRPPTITLHLHVHEHHFIQPCKEGTQPVKWLAMVAAQRFSMTNPRGRVRQREGPKSPRGGFTPSELRSPRTRRIKKNQAVPDWEAINKRAKGLIIHGTVEEDFIHPDSKIKDVFRDGDRVVINLNVGGTGARVTRFHSYAFHNSSAAQERRQEYEEEVEKEQEAADDRALEEIKAHIRKNTDILFGSSASPHLVHTTSELSAAFDVEWGLMEAEHFISEDNSPEAVRGCLEIYYTPLRAAFKHWSAAGKLETVTTGREYHLETSMTADEVSQLLQKVGLFNEQFKEAHLMQLLKRVHQETATLHSRNVSSGGGRFRSSGGSGGGGGGPGSDLHFARPEFMLCLCLVAGERLKGRHNDNLALQVHELLHDYMCPYIQTLVRTDARAALTQDSIAKAIATVIAELRFLYDEYSSANAARFADNGTLHLSEFERLCQDAKLVTESVTPNTVKEVFIDAQNEDLDAKTLMKQDYSNMTRMIFVEFIESLVLLGEVTVRDETQPLADRMQPVLENMAELAVVRGFAK